MNATPSPLARIAGVAIVLVLAAAIGLIAGTALNARDAGPAGGPGPFPNVWGNIADDGVAADDPFTQTWGNLDERRDAPSSDDASGAESLTAPSLR